MSHCQRRAVFFLVLAIYVNGAPRKPMLILRERTQRPAGNVHCEGKLAASLRFSAITFFDNGEVTQLAWTVPACSDPAQAWHWTPPAGTRVRRSKLTSGDRDGLQGFLDLPGVKALTDFMNAGPGVGDYQIEIRRGPEIQKISVLSLMPEHDQLRDNPALLSVICRAKELGAGERPGWCVR